MKTKIGSFLIETLINVFSVTDLQSNSLSVNEMDTFACTNNHVVLGSFNKSTPRKLLLPKQTHTISFVDVQEKHTFVRQMPLHSSSHLSKNYLLRRRRPPRNYPCSQLFLISARIINIYYSMFIYKRHGGGNSR